MNTEVMFSSKSDEWSTPQDIYEQLDNEFHFNLDPCATIENHKCETFFTQNDDGLSKNWGGYRAFVNPPYSQIKQWVKKCWEESTKPNTIIVMLIPARTDTKYFHEYINHRSEVRFIKGRLKFGNSSNSAPFPSMVVIFRAGGII